MPKSPFEKLKLERRQARRTFTKTFNDAAVFFKETALSDEVLSTLKSIASALNAEFKNCLELDKELRSIVLEEIDDQNQQDAFFDEVNDVTLVNRGKLAKLEFFLSKFDKKRNTSSEPLSSTTHSALRSKLPDLQLPIFDGKSTEWLGFWERFQSQVGNLPDLPNTAKFTYLIGQLRGEALTTVKGSIPSEQNYSVLEKTLVENFGHPRRIIRAHVNNILNMPKPIHSASSLRQFYNSIMGDIRSLEALEIDISACAPFIVPILEEKLQPKVRSSIGDCGEGKKFDLDLFTKNLKEFISREEQSQVNFPQPAERSEYQTQNFHITSTLSSNVSTRCQLCKGPHATSHCDMTSNDKISTVIREKLCLNCLYSGHLVANCTARGRCAKCKGKHHTSIHGIRIHQNAVPSQYPRQKTTATPPSHTSTNNAIATEDTSITKPMPSSSRSTAVNCAPAMPHPSDALADALVDTSVESNAIGAIFLKTAKAVAISAEKTLTARLFFDEGSQRSYIRADFASALDLTPTSFETLSVCGFGGTVTEKRYGVTKIGLATPAGVEYVNVLVTDEIVQPLSQHFSFDIKSHPRLQNLNLANDFSDSSFVVDILLGADTAFRFLGTVSDSHSIPLIQESKFGHVLSGPMLRSSEAINVLTQNVPAITQTIALPFTGLSNDHVDNDISVQNLVDNSSLGIQLERLFQTQFVSEPAQDKQCSEFLHSYRQQIEFRNGSYYAPLPWKPDHPPLPSNLALCQQRLAQVTSRLDKLGLMQAYCNVMAEHLANGYIEEVKDLQTPWPEQGCHYLPHFFVLKDSETTPLRIVFAANSGNVSLNDCLYTGPCLLNNLVELLIRFHFPKYAFVADIQRAFLNIKLKEEDRPFVRFLWYKDNDPSKEICVYTYTTIVFGHTSSPMTLGAVLLEHLQKYSHPTAVDLSNKLYVDNLLSGVENEADAITYFEKAREILREGHFTLRQWSTNSAALQEAIRLNNAGSASELTSLLGLLWDTSNDTLSFQAKQFDSPADSLTKRTVLSIASQLFDPLGLVLPVTIVARLFIAELWDEKIGWDQPLPPPKFNVWQNIEKELNAVSLLQFSRWIDFTSCEPVYLHVFTDASKSVIGAVAYLCQGKKSVLIGSKSKLAPRSKHTLTIPQLELSAMLLGVQYCENILCIVRKDFLDVCVRLWTDSEIALFWLSSTRKLKQFVQNKVDAIRSKFETSCWGHTPSQDNPADLVSRGCSAKALQTSTIWHTGPSWICHKSLWPQWPKSAVTSATIMTVVTEQQLPTQDVSICNIIDIRKFNYYSRLLNTSVYVLRFCYRTGVKGTPTVDELQSTENAWLRHEQQRYYPQVFSYLLSPEPRRNLHIPPIVRQLNLFLGEDGLIHTKGRFTRNSSLILLPKHSYLTKLIILNCHHRMCHVGVGGTIVSLRDRFWVPSARSETRRYLSKCVQCKRVSGRHYSLPLPPELPHFRFDTFIRPFSNVGVDFTGHLIVKNRSGEHIKVYICLFTCLTTRAINLEIVEDMTTSSFLQAFRRHCSLFSTPRLLLSDNAQTFKCADQDLEILLSHFDSLPVKNALAQRRIRFLYIPARSPHWGGVYQRLIGLVKPSLKKVLGRSLITLAELYTLIKEIQAVLNDHPLTSLNSELDDLEPLTPSHLLFGFNVTSLPHPPLDSDAYDPTFGDSDKITRAQHQRTSLYNHFINRFQREYMSTLREMHSNQNNKRIEPQSTIKRGDIVLVADTDMSKHRWPLGVVDKLIQGNDNYCRAAVVRTASGHTTRSIVKLYPLELNVREDRPEERTVESSGINSSEEHCIDKKRPKRLAASSAREKIRKQLIDNSQD